MIPRRNLTNRTTWETPLEVEHYKDCPRGIDDRDECLCRILEQESAAEHADDEYKSGLEDDE